MIPDLLLDRKCQIREDIVSPQGGLLKQMDPRVRESVSHRLAIAEGHLKKVKKMVDDDIYCLDVIHQSRAVQAALKKVDEVILHGHLHSCVLKDMHGVRSKNEKMVEEIVDLFNKTN